ncbi:hypothetical protein J437_LFUL008139 [Ladona fulva]|uniref:DNA-directed DNA polymerase n=1 Tax=Ladona fulva TaxID=123851 RepID=A0A8K0NUU0_LADFU|nr:hypothetical protein J437_LFUL008139 [Ladona fulva]
MTIAILQVPEGTDPLQWYSAMFDALLGMLKSRVGGSARGGMNVQNEAHPKRDVNISFRRIDQLQSDTILQRVKKIIQSNEDFFLDGLLSISFQHVDVHGGRGPALCLPKTMDFHSFCHRKMSILVIGNDDNLCLPMALCIGISLHEDATADFRRLYQCKRALRERAISLCERAGVVIEEGGASVEEVRMFQHALPQYQITVFDDDRKGRKVLFEGPRDKAGGGPRKNIDLLYWNSHYNVIKSITSAFTCNFYCRLCHQPYDHRSSHKCTAACDRCHNNPPCPTSGVGGDSIACANCNTKFYDGLCYLNHLWPQGKGKSLTTHWVRRMTGSSFIPPICLCRSHGVKFATRILNPLQQQHVATCNKEKQFESEDPVKDFIYYINSLARIGFKNVTCIAHNAKGYDGNFILRAIL